MTASDDSGISTNLAFLQIDREEGDDYWSYHGVPSCTASSATTSTCKLTVKLDPDIDLPRNSLAGPWNVYVQLKAKDGDYLRRRLRHPPREAALHAQRRRLPRAGGQGQGDHGHGQARPGQQHSTYTTVKTIKTDGTGKLRTSVTANRDGYWRWNFAGTATTPTVRTAGDFVYVR